ncbi:MAG: hypothetical protein QM741_16255 [Rudaea sp.]|uniref:hypothetical protein n=1 Tax=Rudaea sp. TaxID=2136325 RepID=UPI0039E47BCB
MFLDDAARIVDLALATWHGLAVHQFDQHGDMAGLDHVEQVFARPPQQAADDAEADQAAERRAASAAATDLAEQRAEAATDADGEDVGERDADVDDEAQQQERRRAREQAQDLSGFEVDHGSHRWVGVVGRGYRKRPTVR